MRHACSTHAMHARMHARTHVQTRTHAHTNTHAHTKTHAHIHACIHKHARAHALARACVHAHAHATHNQHAGRTSCDRSARPERAEPCCRFTRQDRGDAPQGRYGRLTGLVMEGYVARTLPYMLHACFMYTACRCGVPRRAVDQLCHYGRRQHSSASSHTYARMRARKRG